MALTTISTIRRTALRSLIPPARIALSEWIEQNIVLPEGVTALPGKVRLFPYQRAVCDSITDPTVERVTLCKCVRVGFSSMVTAAVGHFASNDPASVLLLLPTESDCRDVMVSEIEPTFEATPALRGLLSADAEEGERNTLLSKRFAGGSLKIVAARAPRNLRRHTVRVLLVDEADAMEAGAEGSVLRLAERRTMSYANRKIVVGSTPLYEDTSPVLRGYAASDRRIFEVPCPECGAFTEIRWQHVEWPEGSNGEGAAFRCPHCKALIDERFKAAMVAKGAWRATAPEVIGHHGYRINALVSLLANASWSKLAQEFLSAKDDPAELMVFTNTILAEGWREAGAEIDETALASRAEPFGLDKIPPEVLVITAGVDLQDDRAEITICGWSRGGACLVLGHIVVWGSPDDDSFWFEIDELLKTRWTHPLGGKIKIDACAIDSGDGDWTDSVYNFCFPRAGRRVMAIKGMGGSRPSIQVSKSKVKGGRLWLVGVDVIKTTVFSRLQRGQSIRFSNSLEPVFFEQLASERLMVRYRKGQPKRSWERISGKRAEALDCTVYAFAARAAAPIQLDQREEELRNVPPPPPPSVIRSNWMSRR